MQNFIIVPITMMIIMSLSLMGQSDQKIRCGSSNALENYYLNRGMAVPQSIIPDGINTNIGKNCYQHFVIPVVFHVFHNQGGNKVPLKQIQSALDRVNDELRGLNKDFNDVTDEFKDIRGTLDVTFALAKIDPNENSTEGVKYYSTRSGLGKSNSATNQFIASKSWDNFKYCNIYILLDLYANGATNESGVAWVPDNNMSKQGIARIVYNYRYLGNTGSSEAGENFQSVFTHEIGHWLNLMHTFNNGCNEPGDFVEDTPPTKNINGCNPNGTSCNNLVNEENYMDYSKCFMMFTQGQVERMRNALENHPARNTLWEYSNLVATGVSNHYELKVPEAEFYASEVEIIEGQTIVFTDQSCGFADKWQWTINGADEPNITTQNATSTFSTAGIYEVELIASNAEGSSNSFSLTVEVKESLYDCQILFDFEDEEIGKQGEDWTENIGNGDGWVVNGAVSHPYNEVNNYTSNAYKSLKSLINTNNFVGGGPIEMHLISPPLDLTDLIEPQLSYYDLRGWDYLWPARLPKHIVEVLVSTSPKGPWELLQKDTATTSEFYTWKYHEKISLEEYANSIVYISFRTKLHHYYWRFDDVCISGKDLSTKSKNFRDDPVFVYPNPTKYVLNIHSPNEHVYKIKLVNADGKVVVQGYSTNEIDLSKITNGMYFVELIDIKSNRRIVKKVVVQK